MDSNLIEKLRKILALTASPVEAEAALAATRLQELLTKHNLSIADLEQRGAKAPEMREQGHDLGKAAFKWKLDLAEGIAEFYYCAPMVNRYAKTVRFVGRPDNVEALQMLYSWVIEQIKEIAKNARREHFDTTGEHIDPLRWQVSFGEGAVSRLITRLREMKARQQEDMSRNEYGDVTALAVHHQSEISDYLEAEYGYRTDGKLTKKQQEREDRWRKEREAKDELRVRCEESGDMEPYYTAYPQERPEVVAARHAQWEKDNKEWERRERRNAARRTGYTRERKVDWDAEDQKSAARESGRKNADKVNLQPFLTGSTDKTKIGGK